MTTTTMVRQPNYVYQNGDGEYFQSVDKNGELCLSNPSYPFVFKWEVLEPLTMIGSFEEFGQLVEKKEYEFYGGDTLSVKVTDNGLEVQK